MSSFLVYSNTVDAKMPNFLNKSVSRQTNPLHWRNTFLYKAIPTFCASGDIRARGVPTSSWISTVTLAAYVAVRIAYSWKLSTISCPLQWLIVLRYLVSDTLYVQDTHAQQASHATS